MISTPPRLVSLVFSALLATCVGTVPWMLVLAPAPAFAQSKAEKEMLKQLESAIEDYDVLQIQDAEKKLEDGIALAERNKIETGSTLARLYVMLGIVRFAINRDEAATEDVFVKAVEAEPSIEIDAVYKTPTLEDIMERARKRAKPRIQDTPPPATGDGLVHTPLATVEAGKDLEVEATVPADMPVYKVFLHYRRFDQQDFTRVEMAPTSNTRFAITIAGDEIRSSQIDYFILAENRGGEIIDQVGTADAPINAVVLGSGDIPPDQDPTDGDPKDDAPVDPDGTSRTWVYVTVLGGTDIGFLPGGSPTANPERDVNPGFVPAFGHVLLDLGVTITDAAHLGLFFRFQFAPAQDFTNIAIPADEASFPSTKEECLGLGLPGDCILGLKYKWFFKNSRPFRLYSSAGTGIGRVRNWLQLKQAANTPQCEGKATEFDPEFGEVCFIRDTVRTGWLHFGVGGGLAYEVADFLDLNADLYMMLLVPETSVNLDASAGFTFRF